MVLVTSTVLQSSHIAIAGTVGAALFFAIGATLCVWAAWPCDFRSPGNDPDTWYDDIEAGVAIEKAAGDQLQLFDTDIQENNVTLRRNAKRLQKGIVIGIAAPVAGAAAALIAAHFNW